jgi:hypothetical protein
MDSQFAVGGEEEEEEEEVHTGPAYLDVCVLPLRSDRPS